MTERQVIYEFQRVSTLEGWWMWALLVASLGILFFVCVRYYRRDVSELSKPIRVALVSLRLITVIALVFFFLDLNRRTQRLITRSSEVAILVDTSQSMSLPSATEPSSGTELPSATEPSLATEITNQSRTALAQKILEQTDLVDQLSQKHRVSVYAFGAQSEPELLMSSGGQTGDDEPANDATPGASSIAQLGILLVGVGVLLSIISLLIGAATKPTLNKMSDADQVRPDPKGWCVLLAATSLMIGIVMVGAVYAVQTQQSLRTLIGLQDPVATTPTSADQETDLIDGSVAQTNSQVENWSDAVAATAAQSRIGDAIRSVLADHDPATLAGIVLLTDGQANGGSEAASAVAAARRSEVAIYPVGLGSSDSPTNVRVVDLDAPRRVYPGDRFAVTGILQASGSRPLDVEVQLLDGLDKVKRRSDPNSDSDSDQPQQPIGKVIESKRITIANDGTLSTIRFEIEPESVGRRRLTIRVVAPAEDRNQRDDVRDARYEVVAKKLRTLVIAGGPTREYRFVRNLLFRDESIEMDVWLQTGQPGMSQDADELLSEFPATAEQLFQYDVVIMFDPDWSAIPLDKTKLLDRWLAQQAGGMILVAGPVYHPQWLRKRTDPRTPTIAGFFPVTFSNQSSLFSSGRQGGDTAWPLKLTPETRRAEFLWVAETPQQSLEVWQQFGGVYDYVDAKTAKPGAKVYGYFSDPTTEINGNMPVYLASQFYGAGRTYFQGSGEMWRLRAESDAYFDSYYTKLARWVSEGRLLRDSNRGILLLDANRAMVGDTITVRAVLTDEQFEPLDVPRVTAKLLGPGGRIDDLVLTPLKGEPRPGTYGGRFVVREAGSYEVRLSLGDALDEQVLRQSVQVRLPTIELERPRRNDAELQQFASITGGQYLPVNQDVNADAVRTRLLEWLQPQPQTTILPGTPDHDFNRRRNAVLMWLIGTMLTMEWVTRRLHRLA